MKFTLAVLLWNFYLTIEGMGMQSPYARGLQVMILLTFILKKKVFHHFFENRTLYSSEK